MSNPLHVTECFQAVGAVNYDYHSEIGRERGRDVHLATAYDDKGTLDESTVNAEIGGHLESWRKAKRDLKLIIARIEERFECGGITGQPDRIVHVANRLDYGIVEIKSGRPDPIAAIQMAAYGWLYQTSPEQSFRRVVVQTQSSGIPIIHGESVYPLASYRSDMATFRAMARVAQWNIAHGRYVQQR
jgi:hypothetical protein